MRRSELSELDGPSACVFMIYIGGSGVRVQSFLPYLARPLLADVTNLG
jgi:hypothetical protein